MSCSELPGLGLQKPRDFDDPAKAPTFKEASLTQLVGRHGRSDSNVSTSSVASQATAFAGGFLAVHGPIKMPGTEGKTRSVSGSCKRLFEY